MYVVKSFDSIFKVTVRNMIFSFIHEQKLISIGYEIGKRIIEKGKKVNIQYINIRYFLGNI